MEKPPPSFACLFSAGFYRFFSFSRCLPAIFIVTASLCAQAQRPVNQEDVANADFLTKKYKDDDVMCTSSHHYFTFDKGKNALNDKVVVIEEDAELEFLSLKKFASLTYPEFYNKFIEIKAFKKAIKAGSKYATSRMPA